MTEKNKLIGLRLLIVPYFIISFIGTIIFVYLIACGFILFGIPCWILTGNSGAWMPEWDLGWFPLISTWEKFNDDIKKRQSELDRQKSTKKINIKKYL